MTDDITVVAVGCLSIQRIILHTSLIPHFLLVLLSLG